MPIYEYECPKCDSKFELLRPMSRADEKATCPECRSEAQRVVSVCCCATTDESGMTSAIAGGGGGCSSCASGSCSTCGSAG